MTNPPDRPTACTPVPSRLRPYEARHLRLLLLAALVAGAWPAVAALTTYSSRPSETTAGIYPEYDQMQEAFVDPSIKPRDRLLVFLPGTGVDPSYYREICETAAGLGVHAVGLMYVNPYAFAALYTNDCDDCYAQARNEIVTGEDTSPDVECDRANSIRNRLLALLQYLDANHPADGWNRFFSGTNVVWRKLILAGHSQGAGHAAFIASRTLVSRLLMFDITDWYAPENRPATWMTQPFVTPPSAMFMFSHTNDPFFLAERQLPTWYAMGMGRIAPPFYLDEANALAVPYGCSHMFLTSVQPFNNDYGLGYHGCTVADNHVPRRADSLTPLWKPVWTFMLTGPMKCEQDFDGDGFQDVGLFHPPSGTWHISRSALGPESLLFGYRDTVPFERDFDGDGLLDLCVYDGVLARWYLLQSTEGYTNKTWGSPGHTAIPGDYDGDSRTDLATYGASNGLWQIQYSSGGADRFNFGYPGTVPVRGDYDGDGRCDPGVYDDRTGAWYVRLSGGGVTSFQFGYRGTVPVPGDYDGDGITDPAVYDLQTAQWYLDCSLAGFQTTQFGFSGVRRVNRDYDGDGKQDIGVYHPTTGDWYLLQSRAGFRQVSFGYSGTIPLGRP
jgi:hypothetical protein